MKMKIKLVLGVMLVAIISMAGTCEGDSSEVKDSRENITGKWRASMTDGQVPENFEVEISKDENDANKVILANFINNKVNANATMTGFKLTVAEQTVGNSKVSATGTISDDYQSISWILKIDGEDFTSSYSPGGISKSTE